VASLAQYRPSAEALQRWQERNDPARRRYIRQAEIRGTVIDWTAITAVVGSITTLAGSIGGYMFASRNQSQRQASGPA
jgi:hypothetical protein